MDFGQDASVVAGGNAGADDAWDRVAAVSIKTDRVVAQVRAVRSTADLERHDDIGVQAQSAAMEGLRTQMTALTVAMWSAAAGAPSSSAGGVRGGGLAPLLPRLALHRDSLPPTLAISGSVGFFGGGARLGRRAARLPRR